MLPKLITEMANVPDTTLNIIVTTKLKIALSLSGRNITKGKNKRGMNRELKLTIL